jgi:hypothetical protein
MENEGNDNSVLDSDQFVDDDYIPDDAKPLCPNCLQPCDKLSYYCNNCGSHQAINPLTAYMPFQNIRYNYGGIGVMWRSLCNFKDTPTWLWVVYLIIFIVCAPILFIVFCICTLIFGFKNKKNDNIEQSNTD